MFASSSSSLIRPLATLGSSSRHFSTAPVLRAKRQELVEILVDGTRFGQKGDRILVQPGHARHRLVPFRIARWIPDWRKYCIKPYRRTTSPEKSPRAPIDASVLPIEAPNDKPIVQSKAFRETPQEFLDALFLLPEELTFERPTTEDNQTLYGAINIGDVKNELIARGVDIAPFKISWTKDENESGGMGGIKTIGSRKVRAQIRVGKEEHVDITIKVVRKVTEHVETE